MTAPSTESVARPIRLRFDLGYDGSDFAGWACQPGQRTVQGVVEESLGRALRLREPARLTVAGRTDAGVHARGQVCHADVPEPAWDAAAGSLLNRLAGLLPPDVRVWAVAPAPAGFDARFSALARRYAYRVSDHPGGVDPLRRHDVVAWPRPLDLTRMSSASALLVGEHDFAAYCRRRQGATTIRHLLRLEWSRTGLGLQQDSEQDSEQGPRQDIVLATVEADAFCHSMVRALVGALLTVGDGRRPVEWPAAVLAAGERDPAVNVAQAHGLTLEGVRYPPAAELTRRAVETRRIRTPSAADRLL